MCALDAVSVAPMFDTNVVIESECRVTKTPITIRMHGSKILEAIPTPGIIIGIRWQMPSGAAAHSMCMEMVFLKDSKTAKDWQGGDVDNSSLFSLPDAVEFGKAFFLPLLE
jgi:mercuric reductase